MAETNNFLLSGINKNELFSFLENSEKYRKKHKKITQKDIDVAKVILNSVWDINNLTREKKKPLLEVAKLGDEQLNRSLKYIQDVGKFFVKNIDKIAGKNAQLFDDVVLDKKTTPNEFAEVMYATSVSLLRVMRSAYIERNITL